MEGYETDPNPIKPSFIAKNPITSAIIGIVFFLLLFSSFTVVGAGHRGVKTTMGAVDMVPLDEGLHFKMFFQSVRDMDVRTTKLSQPASAVSSDLQETQTIVSLNYHVNPDQAAMLFQEIGMDYESRIVIPSVQDGIKSITAQFSAEDLINERPVAKQRLEELLRERLAPFYISVDAVNLEDFDFSEVYKDAVEMKVTAEQEMKKAEMDLLRIEIEAKQAIAQGEAEAQVFKLKSQSMSPELVEMERLKIEEIKWSNWNGQLPAVMGGDATPIVDMRNIGALV